MNIIVCIDKKNGVMFNGRRQSQDKELRAKIMELCSEARLFMSEYSGLQFSEYSDIVISDDFLQQAGVGDYCFIEDGVLPPAEAIENVVVFRWNRDYPADRHFDFDLKDNGFNRQHKEDFEGSSHKKITIEIYKRV